MHLTLPHVISNDCYRGGEMKFYQLATCEVHGQLVLRLLCVFRVCLCMPLCMCSALHAPTYYLHNNYVTYIVAMRPYFNSVNSGNLDGCFVKFV